jgi:hypothetical protein
LPTPPALGYLVSGPLAGPWLFLVLGSTGSLFDSIANGATVSTLSHASASLEAEKSHVVTVAGAPSRTALEAGGISFTDSA